MVDSRPVTENKLALGVLAALVLLNFCLVVPHADILGNLAVARMVQGEGWGDFWTYGWLHRPLGYRLVLFGFVSWVEQWCSVRSVGGLVVFNATVAVFFFFLFWLSAGGATRVRIGAHRIPLLPTSQPFYAWLGFLLVGQWLANQPEHYAAGFSLAMYFCFRHRGVPAVPHHILGALLFGLAFAQKYVTGIYLPMALAALILVDKRSWKDLVWPMVWCAISAVVVALALKRHPLEWQDTITSSLIQVQVEGTGLKSLTRVGNLIKNLPIIAYFIPSLFVAIAMFPAVLHARQGRDRVLFISSWCFALVPLLMQSVGYSYHLTPLIAPALLTLRLAHLDGQVWGRSQWLTLSLSMGISAVGLWIPWIADEARGPQAFAFCATALLVLFFARQVTTARKATLTTCIGISSLWFMTEMDGHNTLDQNLSWADEMANDYQLEGPGLLLAPASTVFQFSNTRSACRHTSPIPAQRFVLADRQIKELLLADPGVRENLDCLRNFTGSWMLVNRKWFEAHKLSPEFYKGFKRVARHGSIEVWSRTPLVVPKMDWFKWLDEQEKDRSGAKQAKAKKQPKAKKHSKVETVTSKKAKATTEP